MSIRIVPETLPGAKEMLTVIIGTKEVLVPWEWRNTYTRINKILNKSTDNKPLLLSKYMFSQVSPHIMLPCQMSYPENSSSCAFPTGCFHLHRWAYVRKTNHTDWALLKSEDTECVLRTVCPSPWQPSCFQNPWTGNSHLLMFFSFHSFFSISVI